MVSTRSAVHLIRLLLLVSLSRCRANAPMLYHMERMCGQYIHMSNDFIDSGEIHFNLQPTLYPPRPYDCVVYIATGRINRINFYFSQFDLMDHCWHNRARVTVREIDRMEPAYVGYVTGFPAYVCGRAPNVTGQAFATTRVDKLSTLTPTLRYLAIRYQTPTHDRNANFKLVFNSFSDIPCQSYEHFCDNQRCIVKDLTCNGRNPCGDHSDCVRPTVRPGLLSKGQIVGIVVGVSVFVVLVAFLYYGLPKIVKYRVERREDIRMNEFQERHSELETAFPYLRGTGGVSSDGNDTRVESGSSNGDPSSRSWRNDRADVESSELRVRLPDTETNATDIPEQTSNQPPSYESLEQITSISGAQTIPGIRTDTNGRTARHTRSAHGQGVNTPSRDYNREHPSTDSVHESMSGEAVREPAMRTAATAGARVDRRDGDTGPSGREYAAPPPSYMTAMTFSDVYKVTSPEGSNV